LLKLRQFGVLELEHALRFSELPLQSRDALLQRCRFSGRGIRRRTRGGL